MANQLEIVLTHDNIAGLLRLDQLSPPLFAFYAVTTQIEYHLRWYDPPRERDGDRRYQETGRPYVVVTLPKVTPAELVYINGTLCGGAQDALVTTRLHDENTNTWKPYNATLIKPVPNQDYRWFRETYRDVRLVFADLEELEE